MSHVPYTPPPAADASGARPPPTIVVNHKEWVRLQQGELLRGLLHQANPAGTGGAPNPVAAGVARRVINDLLAAPPIVGRELAALFGQYDLLAQPRAQFRENDATPATALLTE